MPRMTQSARKAQIERSATIVAWTVLLSSLLVSTAFNALSAIVSGFDPVGMGIAALPPLSLFVVSLLLERLSTDWVVKTSLTVVSVVALSFSWYHIALVVGHYGQPTPIAWSFPMILDVPMLLAGKSIMQIRSGRRQQGTTNRTSQTSQTTTPKKASATKATNRTKLAVVGK